MLLSQCLLKLFDPRFKKKHTKSSLQKGDSKEFNRNYGFFSSILPQALLPPALITVAPNLRCQGCSELNSGNPTLGMGSCSHFKMHYIRRRILIWNYRFQHTVGLKLDLSLKLSNRKVDGNTELKVIFWCQCCNAFCVIGLGKDEHKLKDYRYSTAVFIWGRNAH